jgi:iron(III) transport system substrate-binding protein
MIRNAVILLVLATVVALPFVFRREAPAGDWEEGDPVLVIVTPHNEAIRYEFGRAFSRWHQEKYGKPVKIDWRSIGGTTEIMRFLKSSFAADMKRWWLAKGGNWPEGMSDEVVSDRPPTTRPSPEQFSHLPPAEAAAAQEAWVAAQQKRLEIYNAVRRVDDPAQFTSKIDIFFGGGEYDHSSAFRAGLTVPPWPEGEAPSHLFVGPGGVELIPERISGETWRTPAVLGNVVSTFGICYNTDRLRDLGVTVPPRAWADLADPVYFRQVGVADPTKSGSIAKAFEMIIHQRIRQAVGAAGFDDAQIDEFEKAIAAYAKEKGAAYTRGELPPGVPEAYQQAIERGWLEGLWLVQKIAANARYFTDSASKVPIDVSMGDAAVGMSIDFYGRYQAQVSGTHGGQAHMHYVTPVGGSSVSCDPISLLRGAGGNGNSDAERRELRQVAVRFVEFVLSEEGQRLWTYKPGSPGGPEKFALRRLPIRRDFYPSSQPEIQASFEKHRTYAVDDLGDPTVDPYQLARTFVYRARWTGSHFGIQRDLIRAMCLDSADELRAAWRAIIDSGGPQKNPRAIELMQQPPVVELRSRGRGGRVERVELNWRTAPDISKRYENLEYMRKWTTAFRDQYCAAEAAAGEGR